MSDVKVEHKLLSGKEVCVLAGCGETTKHEVERLVVKYGGTVVQNPSGRTFCVVAEEPTLRVKNLMKSEQHDVVKCSVFLDKLKPWTRELTEWTPGELLAMSARTKIKLSREYDQYGDSYTRHSDFESLRKIVAALQAKVSPVVIVDNT